MSPSLTTLPAQRARLVGELRSRLWVPKAYLASAVPGRRLVRGFVVLTEGRTGSEALVTRLDSHPAILCDGELFKEPRRWPRRLLDGRHHLAGRRGYQAYGFKAKGIHFSQIEHHRNRIGVTPLVDAGWLIIHLSRRHRLRQAISALRANLTTHFHHEQGSVPPMRALQIEPGWLLDTLAWFDEVEAENRSLLEGVDHLPLVYEDDLEEPDDQDRTVSRVVGALGLVPAPTATRLARVGTRRLAPMVSNYDEVVEALTGTRWEPFLDPT